MRWVTFTKGSFRKWESLSDDHAVFIGSDKEGVLSLLIVKKGRPKEELNPTLPHEPSVSQQKSFALPIQCH
jgi:hypothetical protein